MAKRIIIIIATLALVLASFSLQAFAFDVGSIDPVQTPVLNLFPYPYSDSTKTVNGVTFTDNGDGTVTANGTATADATFVLSNAGVIYPDGSYLSGVPEGASADTFYIYNVTSGHRILSNGIMLSLRPDGSCYTRYQIVIKSGYTCKDLIFRPMLNVGGSAYPYSPYFPYFVQNSGGGGSYDAGYRDGVASLQNSLLGVYQKAQFSFVIAEYPGPEIGEQPWCDPISFDPVIENGRISFSSLATFIVTEFPEVVDWTYNLRVYIYLKWTPEDNFDFLAQPISVSDSDLLLAASVRSDGNNYALSSSESNKNVLTLPSDTSIPTDFNVSELCLKINNPVVTLNSFYIEPHGTYEDGYKAGVLKGSSIVTSDVYDSAYALGKSDGFLLGKKEGMALTENGSWLSLITAVVEAPINSLMSLFSFEVLGLDMRVAFGSVLSLCLILYVIKKVVL